MLVLKQVSFIDILLMLFGCSYLLQYTSEEATNFSIDSTNLLYLSLFITKSNLKQTRASTNMYDINFIHTSVVMFSSNEVTRILDLSIENERLSNLQVVKFKDKADDLNTELSESGISSINECFP